MRLQHYLQEKFAGAMMQDDELLEIFKNPTSKEMSEMKEKYTRGFRFIIDLHKQDVYITSSEMLHENMVKYIKPELEGLNYVKYYREGLGLDRYILGTSVGNSLDYITSDVYQYIQRYNIDRLREMLEWIEEANTYQVNWLSRWVNPTKVTRLLDEVIKDVKEKLNK